MTEGLQRIKKIMDFFILDLPTYQDRQNIFGGVPDDGEPVEAFALIHEAAHLELGDPQQKGNIFLTLEVRVQKQYRWPAHRIYPFGSFSHSQGPARFHRALKVSN